MTKEILMEENLLHNHFIFIHIYVIIKKYVFIKVDQKIQKVDKQKSARLPFAHSFLEI